MKPLRSRLTVERDPVSPDALRGIELHAPSAEEIPLHVPVRDTLRARIETWQAVCASWYGEHWRDKLATERGSAITELWWWRTHPIERVLGIVDEHPRRAEADARSWDDLLRGCTLAELMDLEAWIAARIGYAGPVTVMRPLWRRYAGLDRVRSYLVASSIDHVVLAPGPVPPWVILEHALEWVLEESSAVAPQTLRPGMPVPVRAVDDRAAEFGEPPARAVSEVGDGEW